MFGKYRIYLRLNRSLLLELKLVVSSSCSKYLNYTAELLCQLACFIASEHLEPSGTSERCIFSSKQSVHLIFILVLRT